jgi:hypothetical protein
MRPACDNGVMRLALACLLHTYEGVAGAGDGAFGAGGDGSPGDGFNTTD